VYETVVCSLGGSFTVSGYQFTHRPNYPSDPGNLGLSGWQAVVDVSSDFSAWTQIGTHGVLGGSGFITTSNTVTPVTAVYVRVTYTMTGVSVLGSFTFGLDASDFRVTASAGGCTGPAVPTLAGVALILNLIPTIRLTGA
jgi:hypothetical protein